MTEARLRTTRSAQKAVVAAGVVGALGVAGAIGASTFVAADSSNTQDTYGSRTVNHEERESDDDGGTRTQPQSPSRQQGQRILPQPAPAAGGSHAKSSGS